MERLRIAGLEIFAAGRLDLDNAAIGWAEAYMLLAIVRGRRLAGFTSRQVDGRDVSVVHSGEWFL